MALLVYPTLCDRYQLRSLLGYRRGRKTFLATDLQTQAAVVVKLLLFGPDMIWQDFTLFEREVEILKHLDHQALPHYLDTFEVDTPWGKGFALVQDFIPAQSLQTWVESGRRFREAELQAIAQALLEILDYLHRQHPPIIHRDIKPSNVLLGDRSGNSPGPVYLVDFGSVQTARQSGSMTVVGTYGYMPPEQFGGRATPASDLYSLGTTLIYLATGKHPADLPQDDLRIAFAPLTTLSPPFIQWIQWLTEPALSRRPGSAKQAWQYFAQAPFPQVPEKKALSHLSSSLAPGKTTFHSRLQIIRTPTTLEIEVPHAQLGLGLAKPLRTWPHAYTTGLYLLVVLAALIAILPLMTPLKLLLGLLLLFAPGLILACLVEALNFAMKPCSSWEGGNFADHSRPYRLIFCQQKGVNIVSLCKSDPREPVFWERQLQEVAIATCSPRHDQLIVRCHDCDFSITGSPTEIEWLSWELNQVIPIQQKPEFSHDVRETHPRSDSRRDGRPRSPLEDPPRSGAEEFQCPAHRPEP